MSEGSELHLSVASVWQMLIRVGSGKLRLPVPATEYVVKRMDRSWIALLPIRVAHLTALQGLPPLHRDPFDRMADRAGESRSYADAVG